MYLIFVVDASVIFTLPEVFVVLFFSFHDDYGLSPLVWGVALLAMAVAGEATGNTLLYWFVRRLLVRTGKMPRRIEVLMRRWMNFLILHDERIILLNRVIPVVPFVGAFMAALKWNYPRSLAYIVIGGSAKYSALLLLIGAVGVAYDPEIAGWVTLILVFGIVALSAAGSYLFRAIITPWNTAAPAPDAVHTVEAQSIVSIPTALSLKATVKTVRHKHKVHGKTKVTVTARVGSTEDPKRRAD